MSRRGPAPSFRERLRATRRDLPPLRWMLLAAIAITLVWSGMLLQVQQSRQQALDAGTREVQALAGIVEAQLRNDIRGLDRNLLLLRSLLRSQGDAFDMTTWAQASAFRNEMIAQIAVIGPDGRMRMTNVGPTDGNVDLSDREHYRVHVDATEDLLFVSKPVVGRASGRWSIQLTRRLTTPTGGFGGVIVLSVDIASLSRFYEQVRSATGTAIVVLDADGTMLVNAPFTPERIGKVLDSRSVLAAMASAESGTLRAYVRREPSIIAFRHVSDPPLAVGVRQVEAALLKDLQPAEQRLQAAAAGVTALILAWLLGAQALRRRQERTVRALDATLATLGEGLLVVNPEGRVSNTNARMVTLLGLPPNLARVGTPLSSIRAWLDRYATLAPQPDGRPSGMLRLPHPGEASRMVQERSDGTVLELSGAPLPGGGIVITCADATERHHAARLLIQARDAAESGMRARSRFLATMSHEIRTPINAVIGLADLLQGTRLDHEQRLWTERLQGAADHLLRLVDDILDFSRLDAGQMQFEAAPCDPLAVAEEAFRMVEPRARAKQLAWTLEAPEGKGPVVLGDAARLRQVLLNLLGNAAKFTEVGGVTLTMQAKALEGEAKFTFVVQDSGIGIPPEALPNLFREFAQVDGSISRRFGGSGLGLAICARLVEQMHGRISVESTPGKGSRFTVTLRLPLAGEAAAPQPAETATPSQGLAADARILLAEDDRTNQMVTLAMLQRLGLTATVAETGRAAVEAMRKTPYDLVLMDMMMPVMDGLAATRAIRALRGPAARVTILALTANALPDDEQRCRAAGMDGFLTKPLRLEALREALARHLPRQPLPAPEAPPPPPPAAPTGFDPRAVATMIGEFGAETYAGIRDAFLAETERRVARIKALSGGPDQETLRREAHSLKSGAKAFGLMELAAVAAAIEQAAGRTPPGPLPLDRLEGLAAIASAALASAEQTAMAAE